MISSLVIVVASLQYLLERGRREADLDRERQSQAIRLSAWAVTDATDGRRAYGVVVSNSSDGTLRDVDIRALLHRESQPALKLTVLPPGTYFVKRNEVAKKHPWAFGVHLDSYPGELQPYMNTEDYMIQEVEFIDSSGMRWKLDATGVLSAPVPTRSRRRASAAPSR